MLLVANVGNTHIGLGLFQADQLAATWQLASDHRRSGAEYGSDVTELLRNHGVNPADVDGIAVSCVSPGMLPILIQAFHTSFAADPLVIAGDTPAGLQVLYHPPKSLGADRLLNCVAAAHIYGVPAIVADLGTATTIDCVNARREFIGGIIAPGIATALDGLLQAAPGLPRIELAAPGGIIGSSTVECMQAGTVAYTAAALDAVVRQMKAHLQTNPTVVATGGLAGLMRGLSAEIAVYDDNLTLHGIRLVYEMQKR